MGYPHSYTGLLWWQRPSVALPALPKFQRRQGVGGSSAKADKDNKAVFLTAV